MANLVKTIGGLAVLNDMNHWMASFTNNFLFVVVNCNNYISSAITGYEML
jgi:hypothetical protein